MSGEFLADIATRLPSDPTELLSADEHRKLADDLAAMAKLRRAAEVDSRGLSLAAQDEP